jgi:hypothetical protein
MRKGIVLVLTGKAMSCLTLTSGGGGGGAKVESSVSAETLGQQLIDLEKACKEGLLEKYE